MCGINGFIGKDEGALARMNAALRHRGPDFAGVFSDGRVSIGHALLSIRDTTEASKQPFRRDGSPWVLAFNGQIYNTRHLKSLLGPEHQATDLDTALLFALIEKRGWDFVGEIQGMFAIALYNAEQGELRLYRDPTGQKNLYWYRKGDEVVWSSEIKGILARGGIDRAVDEEAVAIAASLGYVPGDKTIFKRIRKLHLGEEIRFRLGGEPERRFFTSKIDDGYPEDDDAAFRQLIEEHLQSKQRVAINLSGGLDSSLLVHEMSKLGHEIHTYTDYFEDAGDEFNTDALLARRLAADYGTHHQEIVVRKRDFLENFVEACRAVEEPNYNVNLPVFLLTAKREGIHGDKNRVILSGDGGDELFGGYEHYRLSIELERKMRLMTPWLFNLLKRLRSGNDVRFDDTLERWIFFKRFSGWRLNAERGRIDAPLREEVGPYLERYAAKRDPAYDMMMLDRCLWLAGENFVRADKIYMRESLELRSPLSHHPFRTRMDRRLTARDYFQGGFNKAYLRRHYAGKLPDYIVKRKEKFGWHPPLARWYDSDFKTLFLDIVSSAGKGSLVDWPTVKKWIESKEGWPGKQAHLYLSLAILAKEYNLDI